MPLQSKDDFAQGDEAALYCNYCVDEEGKLLAYNTILQNNAGYFQESQGITAQAATKMAKDLLKTMPAWHGTAGA